ncbi:leucine-rich repeat-containing protein 45-like [Sipha flava]|uniref:Leucine-rich repeat-containing protein 45-like n=1 Tax=Sipha flava TaxID=143950 RepID=A0A8B8GQ03_9HEMI|nr:leucine-rich repeat-containing protein 45-like [Sipha flava]
MCNIYRKLCFKNKKSIDEIILSRLYYASLYDELDLKSIEITETSCSLIAETLKLVPTIKIWNLSDCLLTTKSLKLFLDVVYQLKNLSQLNLKGNHIGNNFTTYISNILLNNSCITELRLDWNDLGGSINTFSQFCNSLMSNTVLKTLNLANNNLCQKCGFYLAEMLNVNKCLKDIDLSWNCIGETGATFLLKSLKKNEILTVLNIQGNSVSMEITNLIDKILEEKKLRLINQEENRCRNLKVVEQVTSVTKNYQTQLNSLNNQYHHRINELKSELHLLQVENQQQKQEIEEMKKYCLKEKESNTIVINQIEKMKSELSFKKQSLNSLIKEISFELPSSDLKNINSLEDLEKLTYIIRKIKINNKINTFKFLLKNLKALMEIELKKYTDYLTDIKKLLLIHTTRHYMSNKIHNDINMKILMEQEKIDDFEKQTKELVLLNMQTKTLQKENTDLEIKLAKAETQSVEDNKKMRELENSLILTKDELVKAYQKHLSDKEIQNSNTQACFDAFSKDIDTLNIYLTKKDQQLQLFKMEIHQMNINHKSELSILKEKLQSEKQKFTIKK